MSGGSFNYAYGTVDQFADDLRVKLDEFDKADEFGDKRYKFEPETMSKLRELAVARGIAACRGDDARLDEADAEIADLRGQAVVLRRLMADALAVLRTIEPDDTDEAERLDSLCAAMALALQPKREGALL